MTGCTLALSCSRTGRTSGQVLSLLDDFLSTDGHAVDFAALAASAKYAEYKKAAAQVKA